MKQLFKITLAVCFVFIAWKPVFSESSHYADIKININDIDMNQKLKDLTFGELWLLRNAVYAKHGYIFMYADLRTYFLKNNPDYKKRMTARWTKEYLDDKIAAGNLKFSPVVLSKEEADFIKRVDFQINKQKQMNFVMKNGHRRANAANAVNYFQYKNISSDIFKKLSENNFVIIPDNKKQLYSIYQDNSRAQIPSFITTDVMLQAFHMYFSYSLKYLEIRVFIPALKKLTFAMYSESMKQAESAYGELKNIAQYNSAFYAVAYYLLTAEELEIPQPYMNFYNNSIKAIERQIDDAETRIPYSMFKPRGHYADNKALSDYFKAMQWLQLVMYSFENEKELKSAVASAVILNNFSTEQGENLLKLYKSILEPTISLTGLPDNLSVKDISDYLQSEKINDISSALQKENAAKLYVHLNELLKKRNKISPPDDENYKIGFMPARYLVDNEIMESMVDKDFYNPKRIFPRGLDVFAAFGSDTALDILLNSYLENKKWNGYLPKMNELRKRFSNYGGWNESVYNKWLETLLTLQHTDRSYPEFMNLPSWNIKNLNTSLASWTEIKHDNLLYSKQPVHIIIGAAGGDVVPPPPKPYTVGYVEPNVEFWKKLGELLDFNEKMLMENGVMTQSLKEKTNELKSNIQFLLMVSEKELKKEKLTHKDYDDIKYFGNRIESFTKFLMSDPDSDRFPTDDISDNSVALIADVFTTKSLTDKSLSGVLHEAVGNVNSIYVLVEIGGYLYLTRGAVFSYYEFITHDNVRLTDKQWRNMLEADQEIPAVPEWMNKIILKQKGAVNIIK